MSINPASSLLSAEILLGKIAEIALQMQKGRGLEDILQWVVADARALLQTDRVLIYRFLDERAGVVAFESVGAEWTPLLGQRVDDPCLDAIWIEHYKQGQTTTLSDVCGGTVAPSNTERLERLQVRANLVVPIFSQDTL